VNNKSFCRHCLAPVDVKFKDGELRLYDASGKEHRCPEGAKERGEAPV